MITQKPIVAVDCDDVLLDFMRALFTYLNRRLKLNFAYEDLVSYNLTLLLSLPEAEKQAYVEEFYLSPAFRELLPIEGAVEAMHELAAHYRLVVLTARHKGHRMHTRVNLRQHYRPRTFGKMELLGHYDKELHPKDRESKGAACRRIGAMACIEDSVENARDIAAHGVPVIMPDRPWNQGSLPALVKRTHSWPEIVTGLYALSNT